MGVVWWGGGGVGRGGGGGGGVWWGGGGGGGGWCFFFFQAEDGIRDIGVTGVQTCALPISGCSANLTTFVEFQYFNT